MVVYDKKQWFIKKKIQTYIYDLKNLSINLILFITYRNLKKIYILINLYYYF